MNLTDKLSKKNIILPMISTTQKNAIKEILEHLQKINVLKSTLKLTLSINNNEKILPSAVGRGIAYPHSTSNEIEDLICILALSKNGIDFNSPDGHLCHIILLTLSPYEKPNRHRKFITLFRNMINNPTVRSRLLNANQIIEVINIIQQWEEDYNLD